MARTRSTRQPLFALNLPFALLIARLLFTFAFAGNASSRIIIILLYFACLLKTHTTFANNLRSSRIICSYTLPICSNAFAFIFSAINFHFRVELVARTLEVLIFHFLFLLADKPWQYKLSYTFSRIHSVDMCAVLFHNKKYCGIFWDIRRINFKFRNFSNSWKKKFQNIFQE